MWLFFTGIVAIPLDDPLAYLLAVACGQVKPDSLRIAAAKACLPFTNTKKRAVKKSLPPAQLQAVADRETEALERAEWQEKMDNLRRSLDG